MHNIQKGLFLICTTNKKGTRSHDRLSTTYMTFHTTKAAPRLGTSSSFCLGCSEWRCSVSRPCLFVLPTCRFFFPASVPFPKLWEIPLYGVRVIWHKENNETLHDIYIWSHHMALLSLNRIFQKNTLCVDSDHEAPAESIHVHLSVISFSLSPFSCSVWSLHLPVITRHRLNTYRRTTAAIVWEHLDHVSVSVTSM